MRKSKAASEGRFVVVVPQDVRENKSILYLTLSPFSNCPEKKSNGAVSFTTDTSVSRARTS